MRYKNKRVAPNGRGPLLSKDIPNQRINPRVIITDFLWLSSRKIKYFSKILVVDNIAQCDIIDGF